MLALERRERILSYLRQHEYGNVEALAEWLDVSSMTIRRDLKKMEADGTIRRTHGGATISQFIQNQPHTEQRESSSPDEKAAIGAYAASLVQDGHSILLDAGTTCMQVARNLTQHRIQVVTPDLAQALFLSRFSNIKVFIAGGSVDDATMSCLGGSADRFLDSIHVDISFIGCTSWDLHRGITSPTESRSLQKRKMHRRANTTVVLADSKKYGQYSFHKIMNLSEPDLIITDQNLSETDVEAMKSANVSLYQAPPLTDKPIG
ncbi:DeoR/GlpR family DNA-binding transcription regulator [Endozoicomonadaceae bacterium StTr2]